MNLFILCLKLMNLVDARFNKLSDICADIGQVSLGSVVIPFLVDEFEPLMVYWGLIISFTFWMLSFLLVRK